MRAEKSKPSLLQNVAALCLVTIIALVVFNLLLWAGYAIGNSFDPFTNDVSRNYKVDLGKYYPGLARAEIDQLIGETYRSFQYEPYVEFRERPRTGRYVNVSENGFRLSQGQAQWPPAAGRPAIFIFGGSTTFGYGVRDEDTVASAIARALRRSPAYANAQIYNFGRGFYFLAQEHVLFDTLLMAGHRPDIAIFIDGLNEFARPDANPQFSAVVGGAFARQLDQGTTGGQLTNLARDVRGLLLETPIARLARDIRRWLSPSPPVTTFLPYNPQLVRGAMEGYLRNKDLIRDSAAAKGIRALFIWQPIPSYKYPLRLHADFTAQNGFNTHSQSHYAYPLMAARGETGRDPNFIWCADIQEGATRPLYVDLVHYNRRGAELLADCAIRPLLQP